MTKIVELKTDSSLIKPNFDGYKLSLDSVPVIKIDLEVHQHPCVQKPTPEQYSFLHAELFSMQNLLVQDPWNREYSYFVSANGKTIYCSHYKENTGQPTSLITVYEFNQLQVQEEKISCYNFSFKFISEKFCVFCDGYNKVYLFDTADRYKVSNWKLLFSHEISEKFVGFLLKDARLDTFQEKKVINCAFQHIHSEDSEHSNQLHWGILSENVENKETKWTWHMKDVLFGKESIYYCAFEPKAASIILCCSKVFVFQSNDSKEDINNDNDKNQNSSEGKPEEELNKYTWSQTEDGVIVSFKYDPEYTSKDDFKITCTDEAITVKYREQFLLNNEKLCQPIDSELTTWSLEKGILQITLMKKDSTMWSLFLENGPSETADEAVQNIESNNEPIPNLETPIEDCDTILNTDEGYFIYRINLESKNVTHQVPLGSSPPLFSTILRPGFPAAIATRMDVDASLWLQQYNPLKPEEWTLRHEGNLHAFGYIQASKEQKKYVDCSPDMGYSVISEPFRHVFIYNSKYDTAYNLRNRNGPQISLGKQNLITLESTGEVLGMSCGINFITLLSEKCLLYIQINKQNP